MQHRIRSPTWHKCSQLQYDRKDPEGCGPRTGGPTFSKLMCDSSPVLIGSNILLHVRHR